MLAWSVSAHVFHWGRCSRDLCSQARQPLFSVCVLNGDAFSERSFKVSWPMLQGRAANQLDALRNVSLLGAHLPTAQDQ